MSTMAMAPGRQASRLNRALRTALGFIERWDIAGVISGLNLLGFAAGMLFWYGEQLLNQAGGRWYLWPFIPDCPLFAGLFVIAFWGLRHRRSWPLFYTVTAFGLIKYGVWTVVYSFAYWWGGGRVEPLTLLMCATHVGMIGEGVYVIYRIMVPRAVAESPSTVTSIGAFMGRGAEAIAPRGGLRWPYVVAALGWFGLSDVVDYGLGYFPAFDPSAVSLELMQWHTIAMTIGLTALFLLLARTGTRRPLLHQNV